MKVSLFNIIILAFIAFLFFADIGYWGRLFKSYIKKYKNKIK